MDLVNEQTIRMIRGSTLGFGVDVEEVILDGAFFSVKENAEDENYVFQKSLNNGITLEDGVYKVKVAPDDTKNLNCGIYKYDLEIVVGTDRYNIICGDLIIEPDITREG